MAAVRGKVLGIAGRELHDKSNTVELYFHKALDHPAPAFGAMVKALPGPLAPSPC